MREKGRKIPHGPHHCLWVWAWAAWVSWTPLPIMALQGNLKSSRILLSPFLYHCNISFLFSVTTIILTEGPTEGTMGRLNRQPDHTMKPGYSTGYPVIRLCRARSAVHWSKRNRQATYARMTRIHDRSRRNYNAHSFPDVDRPTLQGASKPSLITPSLSAVPPLLSFLPTTFTKTAQVV